MRLALIGWMVVHSLWLWTAIAGLAALAAGLVRERRAAIRYTVVFTGLVAMLLGAVVTLATAAGPDRPGLRVRLLYAFDGALMLPEITPRGHAILRIAAMLWIAGVTLGAIRVVIEFYRARRLRRSGLIDPGPRLQAAFTALRHELGVTRAVDLQCSDRALVPMLVVGCRGWRGWQRPLILLPASTAASLTAAQLRAVLAHELGHVRRRDDVANLVQVLADVATFHHPAARWLSRRIRTEREYSCDDIAVSAADAAEYARALAALEDARSECRFAVAAASGTLLDRIQRILDRPRRTLTARRGLAIFAIAMVVSMTLASVVINIPPPSVPAGVRMRRPGPRGPAGAPANANRPLRDSQSRDFRLKPEATNAKPEATDAKPEATDATPRSR